MYKADYIYTTFPAVVLYYAFQIATFKRRDGGISGIIT